MWVHKAQRGNRNLSDWKQEVSEWRREECVWCCQQCLPVGSHFLHHPRAGLQPFSRPSRNSLHNLPFIGGQSDAGSWLCCTDSSVCLCVGVSCSPLSHSDVCLNVCGCLCVFAALLWQHAPPPVGCGWWPSLSHIDQFVTSNNAYHYYLS